MANAKIIELDETNTCKICDNALARYSCQRCSIIYCSLTCYQAVLHVDCLEKFHKENAMPELNLDPNNPESKARMLEILKRTHENNRIPSRNFYKGCDQDSHYSDDLDDIDLAGIGPFSQFDDFGDDDEYACGAEGLAGMNLEDSETVWEKRIEDEVRDFIAFLKNKDVSKFIPSWKPWWLYNEDNKVTEVNGEGSNDFKSKCPKLGTIKNFFSVTTKTPAKSVKYNMINLLSAYVFTLRFFDGDHFDFVHETVATIATISVALKKGHSFENYETAVRSVEQECIYCKWLILTPRNFDLMRDDIGKVLKGPNLQEPNFYVLCALTDLKNLLRECQKSKERHVGGNFRKQFPNCPEIQYVTKEKIKKYLKKIDYFLSYAKDVLKM